MSESALLRVLADRLDELDTLKVFPTDITDPGTVSVSWAAGSDHPGYEALSLAISAMVEQHWNALRSQVMKKKESEVQSARKEWSDYGAASADAAAPAEILPATMVQPSRVQLVGRQA